MDVAVLLFDGVDAAEALGPAQVLLRLPDTRVVFVAVEPGPKEAHNPPLHLHATRALSQAPAPDLVLIPGGFGCLELIHQPALLDWVRSAHEGSEWVMAVSTGPVVLAAAGLLTGRRTTGHWLTTDILREHGAVAVTDRIVEEDGIVTAIGAASGIELALRVAGRIAGEDTARAIAKDVGVDLDRFDTTVPGPGSALVRRWNAELRSLERGEPHGWRRWLPGPHRRGSARRVVIRPQD